MASVYWNTVFVGGGVTCQSTPLTRTGDHVALYDVALAVGVAGTLSTRASDTAGTITVATGHSIVTADKIDVYWSGGMCYGATAGTVSAAPNDTSIPFTGATGDVLPAQTTAVVATEQIIVNTQIDGDAIKALQLFLSTTETAGKAHIDFQDSSHSSIEELDLVAMASRVWDITGGDTNVFTGNPITHAHVSNGSATVAATLQIVSLEDATP